MAAFPSSQQALGMMSLRGQETDSKPAHSPPLGQLLC